MTATKRIRKIAIGVTMAGITAGALALTLPASAETGYVTTISAVGGTTIDALDKADALCAQQGGKQTAYLVGYVNADSSIAVTIECTVASA